MLVRELKRRELIREEPVVVVAVTKVISFAAALDDAHC